MLRWGTSGPQTDGRAAPGPTRAGGVWLVQIPPASRSPRLARGSRYSERGRGGSVPQLPQAAPGCPQALARSLTSRAGLLRSPVFTPKVVPGARLDNRRRALRQRSRPSGTRWTGQGAQDRCAGGWLGTRHSTVQRSRAHRPDQLGWRPVLPAGTGGAARRGRPDQLQKKSRNLHQQAKPNDDKNGHPKATAGAITCIFRLLTFLQQDRSTNGTAG